MKSRWLVLPAAVGVLLGTALPNAVAQQPTDPLETYHRQALTWHRCDPEQPANFECATIKVPLDYRNPGGTTIDLAISRIRTGTPAKRRGVLLSNPGGPGVAGLGDPLAFDEVLPAEVREQYDLIGFDQRGLGKSTPIVCGLSEVERSFPHPYSAATFGQTVTASRSFADKCHTNVGKRLPYITTRNTARDMDLIRGVLGEPKISYWGMSYGTYLGAVYMQLFPGRSDRMVLDSSVDPALMWRGMWQSQAPGSELALQDWASWTAKHPDTYGLGGTPAEVRRAFHRLVAETDRTPIRYSDRAVTGTEIRFQLRDTFFDSPKTAAERVKQLKKDASGASGPTPRWLPVFADGDNNESLHWAINCNDAAWPRDPEQYRRDAIHERVRYPAYGDVGANITPCAFWKPQRIEPVTKVHNAAPALLLHNQWDSATTLSNGLGMHRALTGSRLVSVEGGRGHIVLIGENTCAHDIAFGYLNTGRLPTSDVTCKATPAVHPPTP